MRTTRLRTEDLDFLQELLETHVPNRAKELLEKARVDMLVHTERMQLCEMLGAEFAATGLGSDAEPTLRGERIETLIDIINRPNIVGNDE